MYERHGAAEKFRDATQLRSDGQQLRGATETVRNVHQDWSEWCHYLLAPLETAHRSLLRGKSQQKAILEEAAQIVERLRHGLASVLEQAESLFNESESALKELGARWQATIRPLEEEINTPAMADRLVKWLTAEESILFGLETLIPPDALRVDLKVNGQYRSLDRLSVGQQATVSLLLLFALEGCVLILDQPEDDLDNRFVYEDVVQILRE